MERIGCFLLLLAVLGWVYCRGRYEEKLANWNRMQEIGRELRKVTEKCEQQAESGEETDCNEEWMKGAIWTLQRWKEGIW